MSESLPRRPRWIWAISIIYAVSATYTLLAFYLVLSGQLPLNAEAKRYFDQLTAVDYVFTAAISSSTLLGAIFLFRMKALAFPLFAGALGANLCFGVWQLIATNFLAATPHTGLASLVLGWGLLAAVCLYSKRQITAGILR